MAIAIAVAHTVADAGVGVGRVIPRGSTGFDAQHEYNHKQEEEKEPNRTLHGVFSSSS
jgi:hypothetical protein